jgi:citrate synthase
MITVLFDLPRTVGWIPQWTEKMEHASQKNGRPRQV